MKKRNILLLVIMLSLCCMIISGFVLLFGFHRGHHGGFHHLHKSSVIIIHIVSSLLLILLVAYHLSIRWPWIHKNIITGSLNKQSKTLRKKCTNNVCCFILFLALTITGYLMIFGIIRSHALKDLHYLLGIAFTVFIITHMSLHKYSSGRYLK